MRTPVHAMPPQRPDLVEALADGLAELLVSEYRRRHPPRNQQVLGATVETSRGINHLDDAPQAEHYVALSCGNDGLREGSNGGDRR